MTVTPDDIRTTFAPSRHGQTLTMAQVCRHLKVRIQEAANVARALYFAGHRPERAAGGGWKPIPLTLR